MKLVQVYAAREAWVKFTQLRMPPTMAYRLLKYAKAVSAEIEVVEQQRASLIRELAKVPEGGVATLQPGTPEYASFVEKFGAVLDTDCDLAPTDVSLEKAIAGLDGAEKNLLSVGDLVLLEPFFKA